MDDINKYDEFLKLLKNYTTIFYKNLLLRYNNNPEYLEFIYLKGIFLLKNIYILLLLYCENISEIILIAEKAYIYFIEFLIQINLNNLNLELSLNDAIIFTYKKTILSYNKQSVSLKNISNFLDNYINALCNIFIIIDNRNLIFDNKNLNEYLSNNTNNDKVIEDDNYINLFISKKINNINKVEKKIKTFFLNNTNIDNINTILNNLKDNINKKIEQKKLDDSLSKTTDTTILTNLLSLLDNYDVEGSIEKNKSYNNLCEL